MINYSKLFLALIVALSLSSCESEEERRDRFFQLGTLALEDRDFTKAVDLFNESLKIDPNFSLALNNRGVAKMEVNHPYEAILDYNQAIQKQSDFVDALFNRAYAYESIGNFEDALDDVDEIMLLNPDSAFVYFYKGLVQTKTRAYDAALESFMIADSLNPLNPETIINIATIHYLKGDLSKASEVTTKSLELDSDDPNASNLLSLIHLEGENYLASLVEINRALDIVPREPYFLNNRGFIYLMMDSLDLALQDIDASILLNPKNGWAYRNKGIYFLKRGDYDQAIRLMNRATQEPDFIDEVYNYLGLAYQRAGYLSKACESWKEGMVKNEASSRQLFTQNCEGSFTNSN
ncbi:MAG: tetratricopeptide repeat protein [Cyclobacteriaceae bacterium]